MNNKTNLTTGIWDRNRGIIRSSKGGWIVGKGIFNHGFNMMEDLVGKVSFMQVLILNATGRMVDRRLADWFEAIHICLSWPDPRIWCNQIGALGGTLRTSPVAATVAGILAGDSKAYGQKPLVRGLEFIQSALLKRHQGLSVEQIVTDECAMSGGKPQIMGYARPLAKGDERLSAMESVAEELGFENGEHLSLAYEIEQFLLTKFDESMNINGYMSAFLSDQYFSPQEIYNICAVLVTSGVTACYVDNFQRPPETFLPMRCDDITYQGPAARPVPDQEE